MGDVHIVVAHCLAKRADNSGLVVICGVEHMGTDFRIDIDALDLDETRFAIREDSAADGSFALVGDDGQLDVALEGTGFVLMGCADPDTAFLGDDRGADHVHLGVCRLHDARHAGRSERRQVHLGYRAVIKDIDGFYRLVGHLADEGAEVTGQRDPRAHHLGLLGGDRGHVQRVGHGTGQQVIRHLLGHLQRHILLRLGGGRTQMGGADDVGEPEDRAVGRWLHLEHVEGGTGDMARSQQIGDRGLIHQPSARAVDDTHAFSCLLKVLAAQDVARLIRQRHVQRYEIGPRQQLVQIDLFDSHRVGFFAAEEGIISDHLHLEPPRAVADDASDIARADHAQCLGCQFGPHEAGFLPFASMCRGGRLGDLAREGEHQRDGMFGGGDHVAERRVHHDHAFSAGRDLVDVICTDPGAGNHLQLMRFIQDLLSDLGGRPDGQPVIIADHFGKAVLVLAQIGLEIHLYTAVAENLDGGFGQVVGDENFGSHFSVLMKYGKRGGSNGLPGSLRTARRVRYDKPIQSRASAPGCPTSRPCPRTRCAGQAAHHGRRRCHRRRVRPPAVLRQPWQTLPRRQWTHR